MLTTAAVVLFWLFIWQLLSMFITSKILFASPKTVAARLLTLLPTKAFWKTIALSSGKIALGFLLGLTVGIILAVLSYLSRAFRLLISPLIKLLKAVPVASFILLALFWIKSRNLSILISFVMVLPIIYTNVLQGLDGTDTKLLQMAGIFRMSPLKRLRYIYFPAVFPSLISACSVGLGFCWKSGVAAEVIGIPTGSIGEALYETKLYLMTDSLFAWTIVIVLISVLFEKIAILLLRLLAKALK